ncbi:MAG: hypothetical protein AAFX53_08310 [Bacteroidota bacterium]
MFIIILLEKGLLFDDGEHFLWLKNNAKIINLFGLSLTSKSDLS